MEQEFLNISPRVDQLIILSAWWGPLLYIMDIKSTNFIVYEYLLTPLDEGKRVRNSFTHFGARTLRIATYSLGSNSTISGMFGGGKIQHFSE